MKRILTLILTIFFIFTASTTVAAGASPFRKLQNYIMYNAPNNIDEFSATINGTIIEITHLGPNNHWEFLLAVEEEDAITPLNYDTGILRVHFRLHKEQPPFSVGDSVTVSGLLNSLYSSVMIPQILLTSINGSDDY